LPQIFDFFIQEYAQGESSGQGLGLGLGLVKSHVELHGGTVQARSEGAGKGTELIVRLPCEQARCAESS
jgi:signal transduction histidine kinase